MSETNKPDFSPQTKTEKNNDPLKSPLLFGALGLLLFIALFNYFVDKPAEAVKEDKVVEIIDNYITESPEKIASANIESIVQKFIDEHSDEIKQKITEGPQKAELEKIISDFIMNNPSVLIASVEKWQAQQALEKRMQAKEIILAKQEALHNDKNTPYVGNPDGDIHIVEFFDYNCGYCKKVLPVIQELLDSDPNIKISFKEYPILSASSELAAKAALAVFKISPDKYFEFHNALMSSGSNKNEAKLLQIASNLGLDTDNVKEKMNSSEIADIIARNRSLAREITISGTPAFVVGTTLVPGAASVEDMKATIAKERAKN